MVSILPNTNTNSNINTNQTAWLANIEYISEWILVDSPPVQVILIYLLPAATPASSLSCERTLQKYLV